MARDVGKTIKEAEKLLRQRRADQAATQLRLARERVGKDAQALNKIGDLLLQAGATDDAMACFGRLAEQFIDDGFLPKAIAIYKKALRAAPDHPPALLRLGEVYLKQKLTGEALGHLRRAAALAKSGGDLAVQQQALEQLARAEPQNTEHRFQLAELLAAGGDTAGAVSGLLELGETQRNRGELDEAEASFRRAAELAPTDYRPTIGVATCLRQQQRADDAVVALEAFGKPTEPEFVAELARSRAAAGRLEGAAELLFGKEFPELPADAVVAVFRTAAGENGAVLWEHFDRRHDGATDPRTRELLEALAGTEDQVRLEALQRLVGLLEKTDERAGLRKTLERLSRLGDKQTAEAAHRRLHELERGAAEAAAAVAEEAPPAEPAIEEPAPPPVTKDAASEPAPAAEATQSESADALLAAETPAVPLNRADEEFVSGRLTQSEILEKYGLHDKAQEQVHEVLERFPGHVAAQERRLDLLRLEGRPDGVAEALLGLALARRASGDTEGARAAAVEADERSELPAERRELLAGLGLLADPAGASPAPAPAAVPSEGDVEIDFDDFDDERGDEPIEEPPAAATPEAPPDAQEEEPLAASASAAEAPEPPPPSPPADTPDDDLSAITAALEKEFAATGLGEGAEAPKAESEESLDEVFAAFKEHVDEEVDSDDYRTHYDLGIAYKEMGLIDEAIGQFRMSVDSTELRAECCTMLALCFKEQGDGDQCRHWYREAIAVQAQDPQATATLRYDLAQLLLEAGDDREALSELKAVLELDPGFRDTEARVQELEARLGG